MWGEGFVGCAEGGDEGVGSVKRRRGRSQRWSRWYVRLEPRLLSVGRLYPAEMGLGAVEACTRVVRESAGRKHGAEEEAAGLKRKSRTVTQLGSMATPVETASAGLASVQNTTVLSWAVETMGMQPVPTVR